MPDHVGRDEGGLEDLLQLLGRARGFGQALRQRLGAVAHAAVGIGGLATLK